MEPTWKRIRVPERFDYEAVSRAGPIWEEAGHRHCLLELANVRFIDSTAMALLLRLRKRLRQANRCLVLLEPSPEVQRALKVMGLEGFFLSATDILEARQVIDIQGRDPTAAPAFPAYSYSWDAAA
jgi:anti-anti-sigma regulatory factor